MGLETGTRIQDLVPTNPAGATDFVSQGDDHIRLIKACIQGSFPSLGSTAVARTAEELNGIKDASNLTSGTLPDARLSSNVPLKNAAATISGTYTFSTAPVLPAASIADASLSSNVPLKDAANTFTAYQSVAMAGDSGFTATETGGSVGMVLRAASTFGYVGTTTNHPLRFYANSGLSGTISEAGNWTLHSPSSGTTIATNVIAEANGATWTDGTRTLGLYTSAAMSAGGFGVITNHNFNLFTNSITRVTIGAGGGVQFGSPTGGDKGAGTLNTAGAIYQNNVPVASLPAQTSSSTTLAAGQAHYITGNATLPALAAGEWVSIINNSGSAITISKNGSSTTYWTAAGSSISTVTVPARGRIFAEGVGSSVAYVSGDISGST